MNKIELLAPAGDLEKLKIAITYGANAVYFGGENFSLRAGAGNMSIEEITEGVEYCHLREAKAYLAVNIFIPFTMQYFQVMYVAVATIYLVAAILILKTEFIKKQAELMKIAEAEEIIKKQMEEKDVKNREEQEKEERRKKDKEDQKKTKRENKKDQKGKEESGEEPEGSNA